MAVDPLEVRLERLERMFGEWEANLLASLQRTHEILLQLVEEKRERESGEAAPRGGLHIVTKRCE